MLQMGQQWFLSLLLLLFWLGERTQSDHAIAHPENLQWFPCPWLVHIKTPANANPNTPGAVFSSCFMARLPFYSVTFLLCLGYSYCLEHSSSLLPGNRSAPPFNNQDPSYTYAGRINLAPHLYSKSIRFLTHPLSPTQTA